MTFRCVPLFSDELRSLLAIVESPSDDVPEGTTLCLEDSTTVFSRSIVSCDFVVDFSRLSSMRREDVEASPLALNDASGFNGVLCTEPFNPAAIELEIVVSTVSSALAELETDVNVSGITREEPATSVC